MLLPSLKPEALFVYVFALNEALFVYVVALNEALFVYGVAFNGRRKVDDKRPAQDIL